MDNRLGGSQNTTTYTYDTANNLVTETLPNNLQSTFQYDPENRLSSMTAGRSGFLYNLGPTGNRAGATESTGRTVGWSFDGIYRLTGETVTVMYAFRANVLSVNFRSAVPISARPRRETKP
jgi:YD repeat-containing protein